MAVYLAAIPSHPPTPCPLCTNLIQVHRDGGIPVGFAPNRPIRSRTSALDQVSGRSQHSGHPHRVRLPAPIHGQKKGKEPKMNKQVETQVRYPQRTSIIMSIRGINIVQLPRAVLSHVCCKLYATESCKNHYPTSCKHHTLESSLPHILQTSHPRVITTPSPANTADEEDVQAPAADDTTTSQGMDVSSGGESSTTESGTVYMLYTGNSTPLHINFPFLL